jgi:hypothetical protein
MKFGQRMQQFFCHSQYFFLVEEGFYSEFGSILSLNFDEGREQMTDWKSLMINKWYLLPMNLYKQADSKGAMDQL